MLQRLAVCLLLATMAPALAATVAPDAGSAARAPATASATPSAPAATPAAAPTPVAAPDYAPNLASDVFGASMFSGSFARQGATAFNPDYLLSPGDKVQVRLWGGYTFDGVLTVDPKGNIFLPYVGPLKVAGLPNRDVQAAVEAAIRRTFKANVYSYASLESAQPVRIYVSGHVHRPGLYHGTSMDSLLSYLDQAGGIDPERGSFLKVQVKRGNALRQEVSLYDFLIDGKLPQMQLADGDVIVVTPRRNTVRVSGMASVEKRFEFSEDSLRTGDLLRLTRPLAAATHARVVRNTGTTRNVEYYPIADIGAVILNNGDEIEFTADKKQGSITVRVEGEHLSAQEYVLPYGARLGSLLSKIEYSEFSERDSVQLFRRSVRERQRNLLHTSLKSLETAALTARSGTSDEARLRAEEAQLLLQWVERARKIEPAGQVVLTQAARDALPLENGDVIRIPKRDGLVLVSGEVLFPNAISMESGLSLQDYIRKAGGYTQNADSSRIIIAHRDGSFEDAAASAGMMSKGPQVRAGDEILVLPRIDVKSRQVAKDWTQIIYQIAVSAAVVLGL